jgi:hypothetical protein
MRALKQSLYPVYERTVLRYARHTLFHGASCRRQTTRLIIQLLCPDCVPKRLLPRLPIYEIYLRSGTRPSIRQWLPSLLGMWFSVRCVAVVRLPSKGSRRRTRSHASPRLYKDSSRTSYPTCTIGSPRRGWCIVRPQPYLFTAHVPRPKCPECFSAALEMYSAFGR